METKSEVVKIADTIYKIVVEFLLAEKRKVKCFSVYYIGEAPLQDVIGAVEYLNAHGLRIKYRPLSKIKQNSVILTSYINQ